MRLSLLASASAALFIFVSIVSAAAPDVPANDDELRRLMIERFEAAWGEMEARTALYNAGRVSLSDTCEAIQRFSKAGMEVARTPTYRVQVCELAFENARAIEDSVKKKFENQVEPVQAMKLATYTRLDMQIKLHQLLKAEAAEKAANKLDDKDLPPLPLPVINAAQT
jgi:hypothetical protein